MRHFSDGERQLWAWGFLRLLSAGAFFLCTTHSSQMNDVADLKNKKLDCVCFRRTSNTHVGGALSPDPNPFPSGFDANYGQ